MAKTVHQLRKRREMLHEQVVENLNILIGSVSTKGPQRSGYNLTFKLNGVTRTRHIRKENVERVRQMTQRHKALKKLIQELSDLNWEILTLESE